MAAARPNASLYVGNLAPEIAEATLYDMFNQVGPVASVRVCRDAMTRRSLGYAYVNFTNATDAERALDTLNYALVKGRPARIMWSQRDPALRKSGVGNIFIKNLDKSIDNKSLHDTFSAFGNILSCKVMVDETGQSRGFGFVHFESAEAADLAIAKVNGMLLNEKKVFVGHHISRRERASKAEELKKNFTNVFIKNIPEAYSDADLGKVFEPFGKILSAIVMRDETGKSRGFGFVNFSAHAEAAQACELNESDLEGKKIFVGRAQKKAERREELARKHEAARQEKLNKYQGINLFVKNLDDTIDDEKLRQEFSTFGTITSSKISRDDKGNSRGFGFVCYTSTEEATKAVTEMNGKMLGQKPIYVALAQRKEVRRQQLEAQYAARQQLRLAQQSGAIAGPMYGGPMYFNPMPRHQQGYMYPQMMPPRPRWGAPQQGGPQGQNPELMGYPQMPGGAGGMRPPRQGGPPRGPRPTGPRVGGVPTGVQPGQPPMGDRSGPNRSYKYNTNVRNRVDQPMGGQPNSAAASALASLNPQEPLTASILAEASPQQQKQMLGERLYTIIQEKQPELAGKITGMLLDMDNTELLHLLESAEALGAKVEEALDVLRQHDSAAGQQ